MPEETVEQPERGAKMKLVCIGASNPETIRVVDAIKEVEPDFEFLGFVDNDKEKWGKNFCGYPVFGWTDAVVELNNRGAEFCNLIARRDCRSRYETTRLLVKAGARLTNLIHPSVNLEMVNIGVGNYVQENAILQAGVTLGNNINIQMGSIIGHDTRIGDSVLIAPGCSIPGNVTVEDGTFVGVGASIIPRITIGRWSIIGAGTVVIRDVPPYSVVVGNPGKVIKKTRIEYTDAQVL